MKTTRPPVRIEIAAGLGTGKTTLARQFGQAGFQTHYEDHAGNPFLPAFYQDPQGHAFETEITFLMQHYHDIKNSPPGKIVQVYDFSPLLDLAYAAVTLKGSQYDAFHNLYSHVCRTLPRPDLLIILNCDSVIQKQRILNRGRAIEKNIPDAYLTDISASLQTLKTSETGYARKILEIDTTFLDLRSESFAEILLPRIITSLKPDAAVVKPPAPEPF